MLTVALAVFAILLTVQSLTALRMNLHHWNDPGRRRASESLARADSPRRRFTLLLPARHEEAVIGETLRRICAGTYPGDLLEVLVVCHESDTGTIAAVRAVMSGLPAVRIVTFGGERQSKPRGLNVGLAAATGDVVGVFDAEDDVHPDLLRIVDSVMTHESVRVVQAGVQIINASDRWFSLHNCVEYFFWFKSRLHFQAEVGAIPLGGNTVFFDRRLIVEVGGWDEDCLTEDAEIGMRLSAAGERIRVVHGSDWVTREEAPESVRSLVKQRTRWHQGFIQVLWKGDWLRLPTLTQRALAFSTLVTPLMDAALVLALPLFVAISLTSRVPLLTALVSTVPLYVVALQLGAHTIAAVLLGREFGMRIPPWRIARLVLTYLPYQLLLGVSAVRAVARQAQRRVNWEKTAHVGAHRLAIPVPIAVVAALDEAA